MGAQEKPPTANNSMQRVKVYHLGEDGKWDDQGTGRVSVDYLERSEELGLFVIDEEDNETLLLHRISPDDIYRKQEDTIIAWRDPECSTDLALSFQETTGCSYIWDHICTVQRNLHFNSLNTALIHSLKQSLEQQKSATQRRPRRSPSSSTSATIWYCPSRTTTTVNVNKHARQFQKYGCPLFGKLCVIYGDTTATGDNAHASVHAPSDLDESDPVYLPKEEKEVDEDVIEVKSTGSKKVDKGKRKRRCTERESTVDFALHEMASTFADAQKKKIDILQQWLLAYSSSNNDSVGNDEAGVVHHTATTKLQQCIKLLDELTIESGDAYIAALNKLTNEPVWRDAFLALAVDRRRLWVDSLMK